MLLPLGGQFVNAQVGINTTNPDPSAILDVQSTDAGVLVPRMTTTEKLSIASPATGLLAFDTTTNSFWYFDSTQWVEIGLDIDVPKAAFFASTNNISNFLNGYSAGFSQSVPMTEITNNIPGLSFSGNSVTFTEAGTYEISFTYEATHTATGCNLASYYVDFPGARIHGTSTFNQGFFSNHGGAIIWAGSITAGTTFNFRLGRGVSGNCSGSGMTLVGGSTVVKIVRYY
ncbi:MAG: hypothetical protein Aureis2KO_29940 [Aureisphaera sp.]